MLPAAERDLLIRRYWLEESIADMARQEGISRNAMDSRLWRARQTSRRALEDSAQGAGQAAGKAAGTRRLELFAQIQWGCLLPAVLVVRATAAAALGVATT
ncbi:sigma factor-like helix-turn-helix DNA-binding protein [Thermaerobacter litoralis]